MSNFELEKYTDLDPGGCSALMAAVVERAVKDYEGALNILRKNPSNQHAQEVVVECELFFREYASAWTEIDGEKIIEAVGEKIAKKKGVNEIAG